VQILSKLVMIVYVYALESDIMYYKSFD